MKMERKWAMPSHNTFSIKPIHELIASHITTGLWLDPFSRNSPFRKHCVTNDLSPEFEADYHMDALDFLRGFEDGAAAGVIFDPPYSCRQISECYKGVGKKVHMTDTQSSFYTLRKKEAARVIALGGKFICFGWNSGGIGKTLGFEPIEILLVAHGGAHNDTICTVEVKAETNGGLK